MKKHVKIILVFVAFLFILATSSVSAENTYDISHHAGATDGWYVIKYNENTTQTGDLNEYEKYLKEYVVNNTISDTYVKKALQEEISDLKEDVKTYIENNEFYVWEAHVENVRGYRTLKEKIKLDVEEPIGQYHTTGKPNVIYYSIVKMLGLAYNELLSNNYDKIELFETFERMYLLSKYNNKKTGRDLIPDDIYINSFEITDHGKVAINKYDEYANSYNLICDRFQYIIAKEKESAVQTNPTETERPNATETCTDGWWGCAFQFFSSARNSGGTASISGLDEIVEMIFDIGNMIFIVVTASLGVKYIWGSVESKFSAKNSLLTLVVAAIVFYGGHAIVGEGGLFDIQNILTGSGASTYEGITSIVYSAILYIINFLAIGGIIYIGVRYMLAGADGKAEMKVKMLPAMFGIIMVYGTINLLNFILKVVGVI